MGIDKNDKNFKKHDHCTIDEFIHDINTAHVEERPSLIKIVNDFVSYFDHDSRLAKLNYVRQECTSAKLTISYLESQIKKEKEKLNKLELELAKIKRNNPELSGTETYISLLKSNREIGKFATIKLNQKMDDDTN